MPLIYGSKIIAVIVIVLSQSANAEIILVNPVSHPQTQSKKADTEDTLVLVMQRMQANSAIKITYQETRYLELLQEPWRAKGYLYALAPDTLIREQQLPARLIMATSGDKMYYYDPVNDVRHQGVMAADDPMSLNVAAFKALVTGDRQLLENMYRIAFSTNSENWLITLVSHEDNDTAIKVVITGASGQPASNIMIYQPDGDRSEFVFTETVRGEQLNAKILSLQQELLGE